MGQMTSTMLNHRSSDQQKAPAANKWIRLLRIIIYVASFSGALIGATLIRAGGLSQAYADGTYIAKAQNGQLIFYPSLVILCGNIMWGVLRWFLRAYREKWRPGRTIGKLIGGGIWRTSIFASMALVIIFFAAPRVELAVVGALGREEPIELLASNYKRLQYINENFEQFDYDEIKNELSALMFSNIDFGLDASSNTSSYNSVFSENAYASSAIVTLNKAKLSDSGHFVIFYTDTGDSKVSDGKVSEVAAMLEDILVRYKENLGFEYQYNMSISNKSSMSKMQKVLEASSIDKDIIKLAMPVFLADQNKAEKNALATYAGLEWYELTSSIINKALVKWSGIIDERNKNTAEVFEFYTSSPSYPFFNIRPGALDSVSLPLIAAHELGHHFESIYDLNTYGEPGSSDDFIMETAANWMAINVLPNQPVDNSINKHHKYYLERVDETIDQITDASGYASVSFLQNYYNIVPGAKTIIMDAVHHGDALNYLYGHAGADNFRKVMVSLAETNLTGEHDGKLANLITPKGDTVSCADICTIEYKVNPAAINYYYFSGWDYSDTTVSFSNNTNDVFVSLLGRDVDGDWEILRSEESELEFKIDEASKTKYEVFALAVENASVIDEGKYTISVTKTKLKEIVADQGEFDFSQYSFKEFVARANPGCYEIDTDALFDNLTQLLDVGTQLVDKLTELGEALDSEADYSDVREEHHKQAEEARQSLAEGKAELSQYYVTICGNYIADGDSFDSVKSKLQSALNDTINVFDEKDGEGRLSVFTGVDLLSRTGKFYLLIENQGHMGLITVNAAEK